MFLPLLCLLLFSPADTAILTKSPWAQDVKPTLDPSSRPKRSAGPGMGGGNAGSNPRGATLLIRWDSALPVREALGNPGKAPPDYIIAVVGLPAPRTEEDQARGMFLATTRIKRGDDKETLVPRDVQFSKEGDEPVVRFFFPRTTPIEATEKDVTFVTQSGAVKIERKFRLKEMMYKGKLEL